MKNIEFEVLKEYNANFKNRELLDKFLRVNLAHLEDDLKKYKGHSYKGTYAMLETLLNECNEIHLKIIRKEVLEEKHLLMFEEINRYNTAKNKELKILIVLTALVTIFAIFTTLFFQ